MSKKITKKELKTNEFASFVDRVIHWLEHHPEKFWTGVAVSAAVIVVIGLGVFFYNRNLQSANARFNAALENLSKNNVQVALGQLDALSEDYSIVGPVEYLPYYRAAALFRSGKTEEALQLFTEFAKNSPRNRLAPDALYGRAQCLENLGRFSEAETAYRDLLAKYPSAYVSGAVQIALATLLEGQDRVDEAIDLYRRIVLDLGLLDEGDRGFWYDQASYKLESFGYNVNEILKEAEAARGQA